VLADALGLASGRIRIERPEVGGDFGARGGALLETACALVALRTGRPARIALREDHPAGGFERSACHVSARAALRGSRLSGVEVRLRADIGAAPLDGEVEAELRRAAALLETYAFPASRFEASAYSTHAAPAGGSAALGTSVALEGLLDDVAAALGDDGVAFRKKHLAPAHTAGLSAMLDRCARDGGLGRRLTATTEKAVRRGVGLALVRSTLAGADANATVSRNEDGSFTVAWSPCEASTSARGLLEALAARTLGAPPESVAANLSAPAEPPAPGVADLWLTARAVEAAAAEMAGQATTSPISSLSASFRADEAPAPAGAFLAEVELHLETGIVTLLRLVLAIEGASADPIVLAKAEGDAWRGAGLVLFGSATGSRTEPPRAVDLPRILTLAGTHPEPLGAAPIGDVAFLGAAAAVGNAVTQALGKRIPDLPLHPERVLAVLEEASR
jgi:CO/xanthine dehydrogenase Mo-binding subunit